MNLEESLQFLYKCDFTIWFKADKRTCPIAYPKNYGNWEYIVIANGDREPTLLTNSDDKIIEFAKYYKQEMEEIENEEN